MSGGIRIGIDLGGTKIAAVAIDRNGAEWVRLRVATPRGDYAGTVVAIKDLVDRIEDKAGTSGTVGVGMPGSISPVSGNVQNANSLWLNGKPFARDLEAAIARPVRLANDANCLALSEAADGAAQGAVAVFGVILGTGVGGGVVINNQVRTGPNAISGEWGHNPLPWPRPDEMPGPRCWCGREGCLETWLSGPGLADDHRRVTGDALAAEAIVAQAGSGDTDAKATLERHAGRLARGLAMVANILDPDVIVLGGGLSRVASLYAAVPELARPYIFASHPSVTIRPPQHGPESGVRGAAMLWSA